MDIVPFTVVCLHLRGFAARLHKLFAVLMVAAQMDTNAIMQLDIVKSEITNTTYISRASNYRFLQTQTNMNDTE